MPKSYLLAKKIKNKVIKQNITTLSLNWVKSSILEKCED